MRISDWSSDVCSSDLIAVGKDQLLTAEAADARRLQANMFDRAQAIIDDDEVTDHEWFVDHDRQRREQNTEDVLHGQGHGDTADAQSGHHRRDTDANIF